MAYVRFAMALLLLACSAGVDARRMRRKCQKIAVPACAGLGYQRTSFPNKFTNISTQALTNNLTKFLPELFKLNCTTTDALPFLCSVYVPVCAEKRSVLPPCREFCTKSVGRCPALAAKYGVPWPRPLDCSNYPEKDSGKVCLPRLTSRRKNAKGKKADKKKPKLEGKKCCRLGEFAATTVKKCNLSSALETAKRPFLKSLKACKAHEAKYNECCLKKVAKIRERTNKKQERKDKKKERKEKKKAKKQEQKKQKKQQKQQKRKQKHGEKQQKKKDRKQKKQNKKQKKIHGRGD